MLKPVSLFSLMMLLSMAVAAVSASLDADEQKPSPELKSASTALEPLWKDMDPKPVMKTTNQGRTINIEYLPQTFKIHGKAKTGEIAAQAHDEVGPSYKGFILNIHLQPKGEANQAVTPQTLQRPYWLTDLEITALTKSDNQIYWALSYGSRTSKDLLKEIHQTLSKLAE